MITSNISNLIKEISEFDKKQIPFATSLALNNTADIAMQAIKHKIDRDFNVTAAWNKVGGKYGVKKQRASKNKMYVDIFIPEINTWIEDHERGDVRSRTQLIPTKQFKKLYPKLKTNRSVKNKANALLSNKSKNRIFEANIGGNKYLMQRLKGKQNGVRRLRSEKTGRLLKAKKALRRDVVPLFLIKSAVKEKSILGFHSTITKVFEKNIDKEFYAALEFAVRTAR